MGFFSGIGNLIKKNVNFHTLVKVAGQAASFIPVVGSQVGGVIQGLQDAHDAKIQQREADAQQALADAGANAGQAGGILAGNFAKNAIPNFVQGASAGTKEGIATAGSTVANMTIKQWFKDHWQAVVGGTIGLITVIVISVRMFGHHGAHHRKLTPRRY